MAFGDPGLSLRNDTQDIRPPRCRAKASWVLPGHPVHRGHLALRSTSDFQQKKQGLVSLSLLELGYDGRIICQPWWSVLIVNKSELRRILGCSLPTLDRWITQYPDFPVLQRGNQGGAWSFNADEVISFLAAKDRSMTDAAKERAQQMHQLAQVGHNGGPDLLDGAPMVSKPSEMLALVRLRKAEREEAQACGHLVEAEPLRQVLEEVLGVWRRTQKAWLSQAGSHLGLTDAQIDGLGIGLADCQRDLVRFMRSIGRKTESEAPLLDWAEDAA